MRIRANMSSFSAVTVLLFSITRLCASQELDFSAIRQEPTLNIIRLQCTDVENGEALSDALFFLNGTNLEEFNPITLRNSDGIDLLITRALEGMYTCALPFDRRTSNEETLIALPDDTPLNSRTFFAEVGTTAVLDCAITPGALAERYFVTWLNDTSGIFYNLIPPTLGSTPMPFDPRYSIESTNFSLLISDVQLSDSDSTYVCEVGVEDPQFDNRISYYTTTENTNLRLVVYQPPEITELPTAVTTSLAETPEARFTCTAMGDPVPEISWRHNGEETTSLRYHVDQTSPVVDMESGGFMRTGSLAIFPLTVEDSGTVECVAGVVASDDTTGGDEVPNDREAAELVVLGGFLRVQVAITLERDVIYRLELQGIISAPVHLYLHYTELDGQGELTGEYEEITATATYSNTDVITHIEFSSQIPYQRFRVGVAMMNGLIRGPVNETNLDYDTSEPSLVPIDFQTVKVITAAVVPVALIVVLVVAVVVVLVLVFQHREKQAPMRAITSVNKHKERVLQILSKGATETASYSQFLELAEKIYIGCGEEECKRQVKQFSRTTSRIVEDGNQTVIEMSSRFITSTTNIVQSGLKNQALRKHMRQKITDLLNEYPCGDDEKEVETPLLAGTDRTEDHGYTTASTASGSASTSTSSCQQH